MGVSKTSAVRIAAAERAERVFEMRKAGATYDAIVRTVGISKQRAHEIVVSKLAEIRERTAEKVEDVRTIELSRLDDALLSIWPQVRQGNHGAIDRMVRMMERRAKLLGLDAPTRSEMSGPEGAPIEIASVMNMTDEQRTAEIVELIKGIPHLNAPPIADLLDA
jgi:hypothetical protein